MFHSGREMSLIIKSNGHGKDISVRQLEKKAARAQAVPPPQIVPENEIACQTADGAELCANLATTLRTSEVLNNFKITAGNRIVYFGRAVVSNVIHSGESLLCEAKLDDLGSDTAYFLPAPGFGDNLLESYNSFFQAWQKNYRISNEFKVLVADVQSYLTGVRHWLEELEFSLKEHNDKSAQERAILDAVAPKIIATFNGRHERFEEIIY